MAKTDTKIQRIVNAYNAFLNLHELPPDGDDFNTLCNHIERAIADKEFFPSFPTYVEDCFCTNCRDQAMAAEKAGKR